MTTTDSDGHIATEPPDGGEATATSPFALANVRLFILFRIFFNARFYYPVFTILFIDFGLTLSQFAILNAVWAATIVVMEVPSGALADVIGRRKLMVAAGMMMVIEIALLCFAPRDNPNLLFICFLVNRIISGTAEAAASGADEAIAYDTLKAAGMAGSWGRVLEVQVRFQSIAFIIATMVGAAVYDPALVAAALKAVGITLSVDRDITLRLPLYLTFAMSLVTLLVVLQIREEDRPPADECLPDGSGSKEAATLCGLTIAEAFRLTLAAGRWILDTPFVLVVILSGLLIDGMIRMVITLSSQYYRVIEIPEAAFGLIGAGVALLGLVMPRLARHMTVSCSPAFNLLVMGVTTTIGLAAMTLFLPMYGLLPVVMLYAVMYLKGFFISDHLNRATDSARRATVLSFRGLAFNLSYGLLGVLYAALLAAYRNGAGGEDVVFTASFIWFPLLFVLLFLLLLWFAATRPGAPFTDRQPRQDAGQANSL